MTQSIDVNWVIGINSWVCLFILGDILLVKVSLHFRQIQVQQKQMVLQLTWFNNVENLFTMQFREDLILQQIIRMANVRLLFVT